jgi:hypothetical protein
MVWSSLNIVLALRACTFSSEFSRALRDAIIAQASEQDYDIATAYVRWPSSAAMVAAAGGR